MVFESMMDLTWTDFNDNKSFLFIYLNYLARKGFWVDLIKKILVTLSKGRLQTKDTVSVWPFVSS